MKWTIRFRLIPPSDYHTPLGYIPIEETVGHGDTAEEAWETFVTDLYASPRGWYNKIEVYPCRYQ